MRIGADWRWAREVAGEDGKAEGVRGATERATRRASGIFSWGDGECVGEVWLLEKVSARG